MNLTYDLRLAACALASWFLLNFALGCALHLCSRSVIRYAHDLPPASGARLLLISRLFPSAFASASVASFLIPSFLRLESNLSEETVGAVCLALAFGSICILLAAAQRLAMAVVHTRKIYRALVAGSTEPSEPRGLVAVAGLFSRKLLISNSVLQTLTQAQLKLVLRHELAHVRARDNLKRALFMLSPGLLPFCVGFRSLWRNWLRLTEWAADDEACGVNPDNRLQLAESILAVARLRLASSPALWATLLEADVELTVRIHRLLRADAAPIRSQYSPVLSRIAASMLLAVSIASTWQYNALLRIVHSALEHLIR